MHGSHRFALAVAVLCVVGIASESRAETFRVTNTNSDGPGSLRQAILDSRKSPGGDAIEFAIPGSGQQVIRPLGQFLPPLVGPLVLRGQPGTNATYRVVLDGSGLVKPRTPAECPGATATFDETTGQWSTSHVNGTGPNVRGYFGAGLAIHDSSNVEIANLEIRHFCIGIASVRSSGVLVHDVRIVDSHGAAGVIFTGDDGQAGSTTKGFNNRLLNSMLVDNGDGFEFTRGEHDSVLQGNHIALTQPLPSDGNAVEFASAGDGNSVIGNTFTAYVSTAMTVGSGQKHVIRNNRIVDNKGTAMSMGGAGHTVADNTFADNAGTGATIGGTGHVVTGNVVARNGGPGLQITGQQIRLSRNSVVGNRGLGIDLAPLGANVHDGAGACGGVADCDTGANGSQNAPLVDARSTWTARSMVLRGSVESAPNQRFQVELFASSANADGISVEPAPTAGRARGAAAPETFPVVSTTGAGAPSAPGAGEPAPAAGRGGRGAARGGAPRGGRGAGDLGTARAVASATGDGEHFLAALEVTTDASGRATFEVAVPASAVAVLRNPVAFIAATATDADGNTSEFSPARELRRQ